MLYNLVLSGGGVRGYAHIGAVKALLEMGVEIGAISGGSSGAIIGAFLCDGFSPAEIEDIIRKEEPRVSVNLRHLRKSLLSFSGIELLLRKHLRSSTFEQLRLPFFVGATNIATGHQKIFSSGDIVQAVHASSSLPLLLPPVEINGVPYADAGMSNNLPVEPLLKRAEKIIGIHVNPVLPYRQKSGLLETIDRSMHIIVGNTIRPFIPACHIYIEPPALVNYHLLEHKKAMEIIKVGYDHVRATIPEGMLT